MCVCLYIIRYNPNRAALVQSRIKALERMADVETVEADSEYCFKCVLCTAGVSCRSNNVLKTMGV